MRTIVDSGTYSKGLVSTGTRKFFIVALTTGIISAVHAEGEFQSSPVVDESLPRALAERRDIDNLRRIADIVEKATAVSGFKFPIPCWDCRLTDLTIDTFLTTVTLHKAGDAESTYFRNILPDPRSYTQFSEPRQARDCGPFVADYGLLFNTLDGSVALLISKNCEAARLVSKHAEAPYLFFFYPQVFEKLRASLERLTSVQRE